MIERFYRLAQGIDTTRLPGEELSQRGDCPTRHFGACCWSSSPPSRCIEQIHHSSGRFSYIRTHRERPRPRHALTRGVTRLHTSGLPKCPFSIRLCVLRMRCLASLVAAALSLNSCNPSPIFFPTDWCMSPHVKQIQHEDFFVKVRARLINDLRRSLKPNTPTNQPPNAKPTAQGHPPHHPARALRGLPAHLGAPRLRHALHLRDEHGPQRPAPRL